MEEEQIHPSRLKSIAVLFGIIGCCGIPILAFGSFFGVSVAVIAWLRGFRLITIAAVGAVLVLATKQIVTRENVACEIPSD